MTAYLKELFSNKVNTLRFGNLPDLFHSLRGWWNLFAVGTCLTLLSQGNGVAAPELPRIYSYLPQTSLELRQGFANPPREAAPWVIWFWWDGVLAKKEIERELIELANAGFGGAEIRCVTFHGWGGDPIPHMDKKSLDRIGHRRLEYLSDEFIELLEFSCLKAKELGLRLGTPMGQGWPPGGPWITDQHRSKILQAKSKIVEGPVELPLPAAFDGRYLLAWKLDTKAKKKVLPDSFLDISKQPTSRNTLHRTPSWSVPPGKWLIGDFQVLPGGICDKGDGPEVDPASREAVLFHLRHLFGRLDPRLKRFYGTTLVDISSDSWEYSRGDGRFWSPAVMAKFSSITGYGLPGKMHALLGFGPDITSTLEDLDKVERELIHENFFATAANFLHDRGLRHRPQVYGRGLARDFLQAYVQADIPEIEQGIVLPEAVWASHTAGHVLTSAEAFTFLSGKHKPVHWHNDSDETTPALLRYNSNYHFAEGINRLHMHSFSYSPPQLPLPGWRMYTDIHLNRNVPWWPQIDHLTQWIARNQWVLQSGTAVAEVLVYPVQSNPLEEPYCQLGESQPISASNGLDGANRFTLPMIRKRVESGDYQCRNVCLLNDVADRKEALDILAIASYTQKLVCCKNLPRDWSVLQGHGTEKLRQQIRTLRKRCLVVDATKEEWPTTQASLRSVRWEPKQHQLTYQHRQLQDLDLYLIANFDQDYSGQVSFPFTGKSVEIWDADTGEIHDVALGHEQEGRTYVNLVLNHAESAILVFSPGTWPTHVVKATGGTFRFKQGNALVGRCSIDGTCEVVLSDGSKKEFEVAIPEAIELLEPWTLRAPKEMAISNPFAGKISLPQLVPWRQISELRNFAGSVTYETKFVLTSEQLESSCLWELNLGDVYEVAELTINSQNAGTLWSPPYRLDITRFLKPGSNTAKVTVANLLKNHLVKTSSYNRPSGLIGPVWLRPSRQIELNPAQVEGSTPNIPKSP